MLDIQKEFLRRGVLRGGVFVLLPDDAIELVRRCKEVGIEILGADAFRITDKNTQPDMANDLRTPVPRETCWSLATAHLEKYIGSGFFFEVVCHEPHRKIDPTLRR